MLFDANKMRNAESDFLFYMECCEICSAWNLDFWSSFCEYWTLGYRVLSLDRNAVLTNDDGLFSTLPCNY